MNMMEDNSHIQFDLVCSHVRLLLFAHLFCLPSLTFMFSCQKQEIYSNCVCVLLKSFITDLSYANKLNCTDCVQP